MAEFDVVIPYRTTAQDFELKICVKLLRKHLPIRNIYLIGDAADVDSIHVPFVEMWTKDLNIIEKVYAACFIDDLSERFLFVNDDHFVIGENAIPEYYDGNITWTRDYGYDATKKRTAELLDSLGRDKKHFDIHCPIFFEKEKFKAMYDDLQPKQDLLMKSLYCNYYGIKGKFMKDLKFRYMTNDFDVSGRWVFSTNENAISNKMRNWMQSLV